MITQWISISMMQKGCKRGAKSRGPGSRYPLENKKKATIQIHEIEKYKTYETDEKNPQPSRLI